MQSSLLQGSNWLGAKLVKGLASIDEGLESANILSTLDSLAEGEAMVNAQTGELANDYSDVRHPPTAVPTFLVLASRHRALAPCAGCVEP